MSSPQDHLLDRLKKLPSEIRLLIEKRIELYMIEFGEKFSNGFSKAIASVVSLLVLGLAIVFALFALAFFIGDMLDSNAIGFSVVASLLLVVGIVVYLLSPELIEIKIRERIESAFLDIDNSTNEISKKPIDNSMYPISDSTSRNSGQNTQNESDTSNLNNGLKADVQTKNEIVDLELNNEWESESSTHTIKNKNNNRNHRDETNARTTK